MLKSEKMLLGFVGALLSLSQLCYGNPVQAQSTAKVSEQVSLAAQKSVGIASLQTKVELVASQPELSFFKAHGLPCGELNMQSSQDGKLSSAQDVNDQSRQLSRFQKPLIYVPPGALAGSKIITLTAVAPVGPNEPNVWEVGHPEGEAVPIIATGTLDNSNAGWSVSLSGSFPSPVTQMQSTIQVVVEWPGGTPAGGYPITVLE